MSETQHRWSGESVAGRYLLGQYLGGTDHSAVFATEIIHARAQKVAIKLIPAAGDEIDRQLARWKRLSGISHRNLLRILDYGKSELDGEPQLFVVMEYAEENLGEILPQRALNADETRGMIEPVTEALAYLHEQNLAHTRIHPNNILAIGDSIKLSSDSISPNGEPVSFAASTGAFSPPEWGERAAEFAGDVWSLGATVVAALTQAAPAFDEAGSPVIPTQIPEPFSGIARESLRKDAAQRPTITGVRAKLNPPSAPAIKEPAKIDPVAVPLSRVSPPQIMERQAPVSSPRGERSAGKPKSYFIPVAAVVVVAFLLVVVPRLLRQPSNASASKSNESSSLPEPAKTHSTAASTTTSKAAPKKSAPVEPVMTETSQPVTSTPPPTATPAKKPSGADEMRGEVLEQVLPDISAKARATIQGKVRLSLRVHVNAAGTVDSAELEAPSGSQYFSEQSIKAAKKWQFSAPVASGRSIASEWLVRFEFTPGATNVHPTQVSP